jgi:hypothetical protein
MTHGKNIVNTVTKMWWNFFLLQIIVSGTLVRVNTTIGLYTTVFIYDDARNTSQFILTHRNANVLYLVGVYDPAIVDTTICLDAQTTKIVIAQKGCDRNGIEVSNCATNPVEALERRTLLLDEWTLPWLPDKEYRFGPIDLVGIDDEYNDLNLVRAQGIAIKTGSGYLCATPSVVWVQIDMPKIIVVSNCIDQDGYPFTGTYQPFEDEYMRVDAHSYQRFYLRHVSGLDFHIVMRSVIVGDLHESTLSIQDFDVGMYLMNSSCWVNITIHNSTRALQPAPLIDDLNYAVNKFPVHYQRTKLCNWCVGALDRIGRFTCPHCPDGEKCGGDALYYTHGLPGVPIYIAADPNVRIQTCDEMYPVDTAFQVFTIAANDGVAP